MIISGSHQQVQGDAVQARSSASASSRLEVPPAHGGLAPRDQQGRPDRREGAADQAAALQGHVGSSEGLSSLRPRSHRKPGGRHQTESLRSLLTL